MSSQIRSTEPGDARSVDARSMDGGVLLIGAGAILLFVSLFLEWYQPGTNAWQAFEAWDLVLAALAVTALVAVASWLGFGRLRPATWLIAPSAAAIVIVLFALVDPPPVTAAANADPGAGLWLALVAAALMCAGTLLSVARISVAFAPLDPPAEGARVTAPDPMRRWWPRGARADAPGSGAAAPGEPIAPAADPAAATPRTEPTRPIR